MWMFVCLFEFLWLRVFSDPMSAIFPLPAYNIPTARTQKKITMKTNKYVFIFKYHLFPIDGAYDY